MFDNCQYCLRERGVAQVNRDPEARFTAAEALVERRMRLSELLKRRIKEPVLACQDPAVAPTMLPFRRAQGDMKDDERFALGTIAIRDPWVTQVQLRDTLGNAKKTVEAVYTASSLNIPVNADGSHLDASGEIAQKLRFWVFEFFPIWDPIKEFHWPVWAQDLMDDDFISELAQSRNRRFWEARTLSKVANMFS